MARPQLPIKYANPKVKRIMESHPPPQVKYQMLNCQGKEILVGRLKVETPTDNGHAFILRRFDTGAISLTTMFRAAFPLASEETERAELQWVKDNHDLSGNNGSNRESHITRLAGTWVGPDLAADLGRDYAIGPLIRIVVNAQPDPNASYKRSAKAAAAASTVSDLNQTNAATPITNNIGLTQHISTTSITANAGSMTFSTSASRTSSVSGFSSRAAAGALPTPSPGGNQPSASKRRKENSPVSQSVEPTPSKTPLRRSVRAKSPVLKSVKPVSTPITTPGRPPKKRMVEQVTPVSDKAIPDEDGEKVEKMTAKDLHDQDVLEQKKLISDLKAQRAAAEKEREEHVRQAEEAEENQEMEEVDDGEAPSESASTSKKRAREEEGEPEYQFEFKEPEIGEREIVTNSRVRFQLEPRTRSFAWGVAAFAVGMGAVSLIPNFL